VHYPATPLQRGMVVNSLRQPETGADMVQVEMPWPGRLDRELFTRTWREIVARHGILRTSFSLHGTEGLRQTVHERAEARIQWLPGVTVPEFIRADRREPFDPGTAPLLRFAVLGGEGDQTVVLTLHHAILDGRSLFVLLDEFFTGYQAGLTGDTVSFPDRPAFRGFADWLEGYDFGPAKEFWSSYLEGSRVLRALSGYQEPAEPGPSSPVTLESGLSTTESEAVREAAAAAGVSVNTMVNAAWAVLGPRHAGDEDVIFGVTRASRSRTAPGAGDMVGLLINTVPLRVRVRQEATVAELLTEAHAATRQIRDHQLAPFPSILQWSGHPADARLADTLVVFERQLTHTALAASHPLAQATSLRFHRLPGYPATIYVFDEPAMKTLFIFDEAKLPRSTALSMRDQFHTVLLAMSADLTARVGSLALAGPAELAQIGQWQQGPAVELPFTSIPQAFAAQVSATPDAIAVSAGAQSVTYSQLAASSSRIAARLQAQGVRPGDAVAATLPRGLPLIEALLGILKAGAAYVALDPADPPTRTAQVLAASNAKLTLTPEWLAARESSPVGQDTVQVGLSSPAYVSFTSGSTGAPKGVVVPHGAVLRLVTGAWFARLGPAETVLQLAPVAFDASTLEIWGALLTGAKLAVAPAGPVDVRSLSWIIKDAGVTTMWLTAGLFHQLAELDVAALTGVRQLLSGGDVLAPEAVRAVLRAHPGLTLINGYGPTENTTFTTCYPMTSPEQSGDRVPIGRPVQATSAYVLGPDLAPVPVGVPGELYVGGQGLALGYSNAPGLTAERFIPSPFPAAAGGGQAGHPHQPAGEAAHAGHEERTGGERLYRTADLVRWRADGVLEFLGRVDRQVKIRGFRAEPGEAEAVLRAHPAVNDAIVVVRGEGADRYLAGYVTTSDSGLSAQDLQEHAARHLPAYLVPAEYALLEEFPLGRSGKVDRGALPEPSRPLRERVEPSTATERRLAALWRDMLQVDPGAQDDFFALGGSSLAVTRMLFRIRETFGVSLGLAAFYAAPTLARCAAAIDGAQPASEATGPVARQRQRHDHLIELGGGWSLWQTICLRGAGVRNSLLSTLGDPEIAAIADAGVDETFDEAWPAAARRLSQSIFEAAGDPLVREAVAWQGRHALRTGFDPLIRRGVEPKSRDTKHRQHEALVASYLQRYCAKNDTIGFFGPVGWASFSTGAEIEVEPAPVAKRAVHFEGWAVTALLQPYAAGLRPWLTPRLMPFVDVIGDELHVPLGEPLPLKPEQAQVLHAIDDVRTATQIAEFLDLPAEQVFPVLSSLAAAGRIAWQLEVFADDIHPERSFRKILLGAPDIPARREALAALDELSAARDALASAGGDADLVAERMGELEQIFTSRTGLPPTRRHGELYAGRTLTYEECLRGGSVQIGQSQLDGVRDALALVLDAAEWFTAAAAALFHRAFLDIFKARVEQTGQPEVSLADFWLLAGDILVTPPPELTAALSRALQLRWGRVLDLPAGEFDVRLSSSQLRERAAKEFSAAKPGWLTAIQHSPDLMLAGDHWVLGELHPGINTLRYHSWVELHPDPESLRRAQRADIGVPAVYPGATGDISGIPARQGNALVSEGDRRLMFAYDMGNPPPAEPLPIGRADVFLRDGKLMVRSRRQGWEEPLTDVFGEVLAAVLVQDFRVYTSTGTRTPRVTIDNLVVSRAGWKFTAAELPFASTPKEQLRYKQMRAWATANGLPRHVFLRTEGEAKPIYLDLTSLASADLLARAVRRAGRNAGPQAKVSVSEMLPGPDQLWLTGPDGEQVTAELRVVAVRQSR
jgi:amino acid adenylation domain-containing protein